MRVFVIAACLAGIQTCHGADYYSNSSRCLLNSLNVPEIQNQDKDIRCTKAKNETLCSVSGSKNHFMLPIDLTLCLKNQGFTGSIRPSGRIETVKTGPVYKEKCEIWQGPMHTVMHFRCKSSSLIAYAIPATPQRGPSQPSEQRSLIGSVLAKFKIGWM